MLLRSIACAILLWYLAACTTWRVTKVYTVKDVVSGDQPSVVRITRTNGWYMVIHEPRIAAGDTLVGNYFGKPYAIAVSDVTEVATRKVSKSRTIGLAAGVSVAFGIGFILSYCDVFEPSSCGPDDISAHHLGGSN